MSNIPPADFSQMIPSEGETDPANAREPVRREPAVTQLPSYDPAKSLADQIAEVLGEEPATPTPQHLASDATEFPTTQPPPQPREDATPPPAQVTGTGEGEGGSDAVSGSSAAPPDSPDEGEKPTDDDRLSLDALAEQLYGRPPTRDESLAFMQLWQDMARLDDNQRHQVAVAMGYVQEPPTAPQAPAPSTQQQQEPQEPDPNEDPYIAPHIAPLREELSSIRGQVQSLVSDRQQSDMQRLQSEVNDALNNFRETYSEFSPEEHAALQMRMRENGIVAAHYNATGNIQDAVNKSLQFEMWNDENLRSKILASQQQQEQQSARDDQQRQQRAASLSPGGSQVPRDEAPSTPPKDVVLDRWQARQAMVDELTPIFNQNQ